MSPIAAPRRREAPALGRGVAVAIAVVALLAAACSTRPDLTDPREILDGAVMQLDEATSVRLQLDVSGAIVLGVPGAGSPRPLLLEGTTLTADLDLAGGRAKATFAAPALLGLTGEFRAPGDRSYLKMSLLGPKFFPIDGGGGSPPGATPAPISLSALSGLLDDPSVTATKLDDADCAGKRCYRIRVEVDPSAIDLGLPDLGALTGLFGLLGIQLPTPDGGGQAPIEPVEIVVAVDKETLRPVTLESDVAVGETVSLEVLLTLSAWGERVDVTAPPPDEVGEPGGFPFELPVP